MVEELQHIEEKELLPGFKVKFVHGESMTTAFWTIEKGAVLPEHSHIHEQVSIVTEGEFELTVEGKTSICKPGKIAVIPSNAVHSGKALSDCRMTDIFSPVREEYK